MRVLLTGGSGSVGKAVVDWLVKKGHSVLVIGRRVGLEIEGAEYQACDINEYPRVREVIRGCDAVVHLAAIPNPGSGAPEQIFSVNCQGTFNVFQAAAQEGIRRVVQASSINATGQFYGLKPAPIHYLPMDEEHPVSATDAYSFSKHVIEEIGDYFWRREGISSLALRLPYVAPATYQEAVRSTRRPRIREVMERLDPMSADERLGWFERTWAWYNDFRSTRPYEDGRARQYLTNLPDEERAALMAMSNRVNFFTMVDERDSAQAVDKGLEASFEGSHTLFINDSHNWSGVASMTLIEYFYPDVKVLKKELAGTETIVSIDRARQLIGFEPEFTFDEGKDHA